MRNTHTHLTPGRCATWLTMLMIFAGTALAAPPVASTPKAAAGRDYVAEVRANFTPENRAYSNTRSALAVLSPIYDIAVALLLLFTGLSARMSAFAASRVRGRYLRMLAYFSLFIVAVSVLQLPLAWYQGFAIEHHYGLSNQSLGAWLGDQAKDAAVDIVFLGALGLITLAYLAIEKSPRRWWMWLALGTLPVLIVSIVIEPVFIDPLYNKFTPLKDQQLKTRILDLAAKAEIPARRVYQVDKSRQTKKYNAYVNGFGASQRIVLWDTTLEGMSQDEILFVMGHEMGHYKLAHVWKGVAFYWILLSASYLAAWWIGNALIRRCGARWRIGALHDPGSMPLLFATLTALSMIVQPLANAYHRRVEHEADVFGLEVTHSNDAGARAFIKLGSQNKSNPEPPAWMKIYLYTHPPLIERIRFALDYRPWEEGKPNRAFHPRSSAP